jgi:hypothetical protein
MDTSYSAYFTTVHSIADEAYELQKEDGYAEAADYVWQCVDGSAWVIHTHAARAVLAHSPNDEAIIDEMGSVTVDDFTTFYTRAAFYAMRADIEERLGALGAR